MSEIVKIEKEIQEKANKLSAKLYKELIFKIADIRAECKHEKMHWIQELNKAGHYKNGLFKRCFVCGLTLDTFDSTADIMEQILYAFDIHVEQKITESKQSKPFG